MDYKVKYEQAIADARAIIKDYKERHLDDIAKRSEEDFSAVFSELKESEDEKIRKGLIDFVNQYGDNFYGQISKEYAIAWLEKQGEKKHQYKSRPRYVGEAELLGANKQGEKKPNPYSGTSFECDGHTWGMCARDNGVELLLDGELKAFLSLEKSFIYPIHSQSELAPKSALEAVNEEKVDNANKVEPKFCKGDWVVNELGDVWHIDSFDKKNYQVSNGNEYNYFPISMQNEMHLWSITDAKDGDVLATKDAVFIFKHIDKTGLSLCKSYCEVIGNSELGLGFDFSMNNVYPATKEQRDTLFSKMKEEGYVWLSGKKRLVKLLFKEGDTVRKKLDGSIWHINYINEHGYWGNHKPLFPIENQNEFELVEKKHWSEEDEKIIQWIATDIKRLINDNKKANIIADQEIKWLESLRPRSQWKPSDEQMDALDSTLQYSQVSHNSFEHLNSLFNDLKKLKL